MNKMLRVRQEYGEPFVEVVKGYAKMRMSKRLTAKAMGFNLPYSRQLLTRFDLHKYFLPQKDQADICHPGRRRGYKNISRWGPITHNGITWYPGESTHHYLRELRTGTRLGVAGEGGVR